MADRAITLSQFEAALAMLRECIDRCPESAWDEPVAKYPVWQVVYHTLCFVDCYLSPSNEEFRTRADMHPRGMEELDAETPSRRFTRDEMLRYTDICLEKMRGTIPNESDEVLAGPSGFSWLKFNRAQVHLYNMRHVQHHVGALGATLRRHGVELGWVKAGWR